MKYIFILPVMLVILFAGCKKIDEFTQFEMEYNESVTIPSTTGANFPMNLLTPDVSSNSESTFAINDTRKDLIEEIKLIQLDLTLTSPSNGNFEFLKSVEIFISADGLDDVKVAWKENIPSNVGKELFLETTKEDLMEFIKKDEFVLKVNTITDEALSSDHKIDVHSKFFIDAKILGQ